MTLRDYDFRAPFPYFGGKRRIAAQVWERFGDTPNYCEPFAGSLAVLLARPHAPKTETVNDADCYLSNFWRALQADPDGVAKWADWPVNEVDLVARNRYFISAPDALAFREKMFADPECYDVKLAGWWVWGLCAWIGSGWASANTVQIPHLMNAGQGINRKLPHLGNAGKGIAIYFNVLSDRLRRVRVACGDWTRIMGECVTTGNGLTSVFLDPPYGVANRSDVYACESKSVAADVREWAIANGDNPLLRIALCGYNDEHDMPASWECLAWKTNGGYGVQGNAQGRINKHRERIWFSPHCLQQGRGLFADEDTPNAPPP